LGEFLQINKRDMTACKPDKAAILSEVVKKVSAFLFLGFWGCMLEILEIF
jgi:hypothetical protein